MEAFTYSLSLVTRVLLFSWEETNILPYYYTLYNKKIILSMRMIIILNKLINPRGIMKKIFILEINEKDKSIDNYDIINTLEKKFKVFSEIINTNNSIYLRFKRVGNTWQNIIDKAKNTKQNTKNDFKDISGNKKTNHLKVVK